MDNATQALISNSNPERTGLQLRLPFLQSLLFELINRQASLGRMPMVSISTDSLPPFLLCLGRSTTGIGLSQRPVPDTIVNGLGGVRHINGKHDASPMGCCWDFSLQGRNTVGAANEE